MQASQEMSRGKGHEAKGAKQAVRGGREAKVLTLRADCVTICTILWRRKENASDKEAKEKEPCEGDGGW